MQIVMILIFQLLKFFKQSLNKPQAISKSINQMEGNQGQQFHYFIQLSADKPKYIQKFAEFEYMEYAIRKNYKQLKKIKLHKNLRPNQKFTEYFKSLEKDEQIKYYQKCLKLLKIALINNLSSEQRKKQRQVLKKQGQAYVKKTIINKWEKKNIKLNNLNFVIVQSKKERAYPLKFYAIRRSKNKEHYGWVLEALNDQGKRKLRNIHCGVRNINDFEIWFELLEKSIDCAKINLYRNTILGLSAEDEPKSEKKFNEHLKTITQIFIDNQMRVGVDMEENLQCIIEEQKAEQKTQMKQNQQKPKLNPNVFKRLFSQVDLNNFAQNSINSTLIQNGPGFRLVQLSTSKEEFRLRINIIIPFNKSLVFKALTQESNLWNNEIDIFSVKTKISSENSALIYQKDKAQGLLYRERDYLFFRHSFSITTPNPNEKSKIFIADKSIDSISFPPFMTVARGEKKIVYCIIGNQEDKESMLIVEGQIKGGGYMNVANDKEMTIKYLKKFIALESFLKEKKFINGDQKEREMIFKENWEVQQKEDESFYDVQNNEVDSEDQSNEEENNTKEASKSDEQKNRKFSSNSDPQNSQFQEFIRKTTEEQIMTLSQLGEIKPNVVSQKQLTLSKIYPYTAPKIAEDNTVILPQSHLKGKHILNPLPKPQKPSLFPHYRGHHLYKGEWAVCPTGGLNYVDQQKMNEQKKVLTFIIKRIGKNIFTGKGILNISLPVDIFCRQSNIERFAATFGYFPMLLEKASTLSDPKQQLKYIIGGVHMGSLIYMTMQKPFNPILGETYQSWIDGCPVYFEQISHHPPIAAYLMIGRGYKLSGTLQAKMDISINSGTGCNEGIFTVEFDNGRKFHYTTAPGELSGLTYGERKLLLVGKTYYWCVEEGLFLQLQYNPSSKNRRFFGGSNVTVTGDVQYHDFIEGTLKKYKKQDLEEFLTPKKGDFRKVMAIPKASPTVQHLCEYYKVSGRWTKYIAFDGQKMFDYYQSRYCTMKDQQNPLPSNSNYREDVVYRRLNNVVQSQEFKEVLQIKQRKDKKLREVQEKNRK